MARTVGSSPGVLSTVATPAPRVTPSPRVTPPPRVTPAAALARPGMVATGDLQPGTIVGEYQIVGKLGEGGMGSVYSATHPVIGKKAAVKVIAQALCTSPDAVERFVQEAGPSTRSATPTS